MSNQAYLSHQYEHITKKGYSGDTESYIYIVLRKNVLIRRRDEKARSAVALVTGNVKNSFNWVCRSAMSRSGGSMGCV